MGDKINSIKIFNLSYFKLLFLFHIFIVSIFVVYSGLKRNELPIWIYNLLILLGILIIIYHIYRLYTHGLRYPIWNSMHILIIAPLIIYIGYKQKTTDTIFYDLILTFASACLGINIYYLYRTIKN